MQQESPVLKMEKFLLIGKIPIELKKIIVKMKTQIEASKTTKAFKYIII